MIEGSNDQSDVIPDLDLEIDFDSDADLPSRIERRKHERPKPRLSGYRVRARNIVDHIVKLIDSSWVGVLGLISIIGIAVALLWWTLGPRADKLDHRFELVELLSARKTEFSQLLAKLSQPEYKNLRERVSKAEISIFPDYARLAGWLSEQSRIAKGFSLSMLYTMKAAEPSNIANVSEQPIEMEIVANKSGLKNSYLRMLEFTKRMVDDQWHLEITNASMSSDGVGVSSFMIAIRVWVRDKETINTVVVDEEIIK